MAPCYPRDNKGPVLALDRFYMGLEFKAYEVYIYVVGGEIEIKLPVKCPDRDLNPRPLDT